MSFNFTIGSKQYQNVTKQQLQDIARKWRAQHAKLNGSF